ncbi:helix-turn-helix transcriptional regulator [Enterococcus sp. BWB1-3]|uniref:helix-turn-helix domain-containing protein n=1 Tax=Enterococcus sp. BWB1-3 TaxID=2787713 RepID=UPI0019213316|nr:helix-turn-helix transcriptional regulator [Enterococcus sp. BWB1-3]MBL1228220.1 helix-turn-helix transcriptional regulator [Enterococcus sp. BWB1-3]
MNVGEVIRQKRKVYNYTQQNLADQLRVSRTTISSWETGRTYPDLSMLIALSGVFETSVDYLLKGDVEMVSELDKSVRRGRKSKYYLGVLLAILVLLVVYFSAVYIKKNNLYKNVNEWQRIGGAYSLTEEDMTYMVGYSDSLDIRNISNELGLLADRSNDDNSQITMIYNGNDDDIQVSFRSGPIEGMSFIFDKNFILNDEAENSNRVRYSYEIRKNVNDILKKESSYFQDTFEKVKNKWGEINEVGY